MLSGPPWQNPEGKIAGSRQAIVPVIRFYGVTSEGTSVMVSVHGFTPYFYVSLPPSIDLNDTFLGAARNALDQRVSHELFYYFSFFLLIIFLIIFILKINN